MGQVKRVAAMTCLCAFVEDRFDNEFVRFKRGMHFKVHINHIQEL